MQTTNVNANVKYENVISSVSDCKTIFHVFSNKCQREKNSALHFNIHCTEKDRDRKQTLPTLISTVWQKLKGIKWNSKVYITFVGKKYDEVDDLDFIKAYIQANF